MALSDAKIKAANPQEKDYKIYDQRGLYLLIKKSGAKYWRMKYRFAGKEKTLALGVYPEISLKKAREKTDEARQKVQDNIDPVEERKSNKQSLIEEVKNKFETIANDWLKMSKTKWSDGHYTTVENILTKDILLEVGKKSIADITTPELLSAIRLIEDRNALETAAKARKICSQIFRYAISLGITTTNPAASLVDVMQKKTVRHMPAITDPKDFGKLLVAIYVYEGSPIVKCGLKISPILFQRPGEIRHMEWKEINWEENRWEIPASKMKMRQDHIVPLPKQAIEILKEIEHLTCRCKYVFPNYRKGDRPMSENAVRVALRTMGFDNDTITPHGFRATARTLLDEVLQYRIDWIEQQLSHTVKDSTGRAYNRTKHLAGRTEMMQAWADYLDQLREQAAQGNVVAVNFNR